MTLEQEGSIKIKTLSNSVLPQTKNWVKDSKIYFMV